MRQGSRKSNRKTRGEIYKGEERERRGMKTSWAGAEEVARGGETKNTIAKIKEEQ